MTGAYTASWLCGFGGWWQAGQVEKKAEQIKKLDGGLIKKVMMMCDVPTTGTKVCGRVGNCTRAATHAGTTLTHSRRT
eukprot:5228028-Prymnesium_polylepis.1